MLPVLLAALLSQPVSVPVEPYVVREDGRLWTVVAGPDGPEVRRHERTDGRARCECVR